MGNLNSRQALAMAVAVVLLCAGCASTSGGGASAPLSPAQMKAQDQAKAK